MQPQPTRALTLCASPPHFTQVHTLAKLNDFYLVDTLLACLSNLAPHVERLHP